MVYLKNGAFRVLCLSLSVLLIFGSCKSSGSESSNTSSDSRVIDHKWTEVVPAKTAQESAAAFNNKSSSVVDISSNTGRVYTPVEDASFAHHPFLTYFKGRFYAMFSLGYQNEDDCGQHVMYAVSSDGLNWETPKPLVDVTMGEHSEYVMVPMGFYNDNDQTLVAYYWWFEYDESSLRGKNLRPLADTKYTTKNKRQFALVSKDGENWTKSVTFASGGGGNYPPISLKSGRLLMTGATVHSFTDDLSGTGRWSMSVTKTGTAYERGASLLTESSAFQTDDGIIHLLIRTNTDYLWYSESYDDGVTWTEPHPTNFTDCWAKFQFNRLPDGRFYYVGNPVPGSSRNPLVLIVSDDGVNFDKWFLLRKESQRRQFDGLYKSGVYGYPHSIIVGDYMYVIYSIYKEIIEVSRIALSDLQ